MSNAPARWLHRLQRVTLAEVGLIVEAQLMLLHCQMVCWQRPAGQLLRVEPLAAERATSAADARTALLIGWAVTRATSYGVFRPACLVRALAMQRMLQRRGIQGGELRIGVRLQEQAFQAHAWVELDGLVLGDTVQHVRSFTPTTDLRLVQL